ncbi:MULTISPECIES: hypothetical protein [Gemella]|uniref:hypothetical protein n=1 Tax=Gemella TaxID=1378 RepID=UPI0007684078|nr:MULTISPECIES: hypothetical protein [Gemella]AME09893.1 hypothetical protein AXE85_06905 [Gemella sp. oral taxon 928]AXI26032.1 hypothetical protein CG018_00520 [Gemella sp. ND 6198]
MKKKLLGAILAITALIIFLGDTILFPKGIIFLIISTIVLGYIIIKNIIDFDSFGTIFPLALLFYIYNKNFYFLDISAGKIFISALLLSIGASLLLPKKLKYKEFKKYKKEYSDMKSSNIIFGNNSFYININDTNYFASTSTFSTTNIYFEKLNTYYSKEFTLDISATFSTVKLFIPKEWNINNNINSTISEITYPLNLQKESEISLNLIGSATFAEVEILYI